MKNRKIFCFYEVFQKVSFQVSSFRCMWISSGDNFDFFMPFSTPEFTGFKNIQGVPKKLVLGNHSRNYGTIFIFFVIFE